MPNDRLLSDEKICKACGKMEKGAGDENGPAECIFEEVPVFLKAQDLKTAAAVNAEWVERMEKYGDSCKCGFCSYRIPNCYPANMSCFLWQQLKKNMGAK
jgi:hypothetical protein